MKDLFLLPVLILLSLLGYWLMGRIDQFLEENASPGPDTARERELIIYASSPFLFAALDPVLDLISDREPTLSFSFRIGEALPPDNLLGEGRADFVLSERDIPAHKKKDFLSLPLTLSPSSLTGEDGIPIRFSPREEKILLIWDPSNQNSARDRFLTILKDLPASEAPLSRDRLRCSQAPLLPKEAVFFSKKKKSRL